MYVALAVTLGVVMGISTAFMMSRVTQQVVTSTLTFGSAGETYDYYDAKQTLIVVAAEYALMLITKRP